jgi:hypothetical protein
VSLRQSRYGHMCPSGRVDTDTCVPPAARELSTIILTIALLHYTQTIHTAFYCVLDRKATQVSFKQRYITGAGNCSTKPLPKLLSYIHPAA